MAVASGCYGAFFGAQTVGPCASSSVALVLSHNLGVCPFVFMTLVGSPVANQSIQQTTPHVTVKNASQISLATNTLSGCVVDVWCSLIPTLIQ